MVNSSSTGWICRMLHVGKMRWCAVGILLFLAWLQFSSPAAIAQGIRPVGRFERSGDVRQISNGQITVRHDDGRRIVYRIQDQDEAAMAMEGARIISNNPAQIQVKGVLDKELAEPGMKIKLSVTLNESGKTVEPIKHFFVVDQKSDTLLEATPTDEGAAEFKCTVIGRLRRTTRSGLLLDVPKSRFARRGRIEIKVADSTTMEFEMQNLNRVIPGDRVERMSGVRYSNGERVVQSISIKMTAPRKKIETSASWHDQLVRKYGDLSDEPVGAPRTVKSAHFVLYTDVSPQSANVLLAKLETMYRLIRYYYGKRPPQAIECYVVNDLNVWPRNSGLAPVAIEAISRRTGVTVSGSAPHSKAIVYSCDDHNTVQHEAVHAFCKMTFGSTGPTWYSEGMAEMGNYWRPNDLSVNIDPVVIEYLTSGEIKPMYEIVHEEQISGDSWRAYAWRWALCHLLANNSNYSSSFKKLGINMMTGRRRDSFYDTFGKFENRLAFEYDQFLQHLSNGYRVSLCQWDWKTRAAELTGEKRVKTEVAAGQGWQATTLKLVKGKSYDIAAQGQWKITHHGPGMSADGRDGEGQLIGTVFDQFELSEPFALGKKRRFIAPADGQLFLRCADRWNELHDNTGEITVHVRLSPTQ